MSARPKLAAPSLDYLIRLRREQEMVYHQDDVLIDGIRAVRTLSDNIRLDDKYRITDMEYHDPSIFDEHARVANSLSLKTPKMHVKVRPSQGTKGEDNASNREEWTWGVLDHAGRKEPGHNAWKDSVDASVEGGAWSRLVFQSDLWDKRWAISDELGDKEYDKLTEDAKKEAGQPFVWNVIDSRTIYPVFSGNTLTEVLIVNKRPRNQAFREYRLKQLSNGQIVPEDLGTNMNVMDDRLVGPWVYTLEHWDDTWYTFAVQDQLVTDWGDRGQAEGYGPGKNGRPIDQFEHNYKRVPFFPAPGYVINWQHGRKIGWGIAESKRWLVEYYEYLMTIYGQVAARDLGKVIVRSRSQGGKVATAGADRQPQDKEFWEPFEIITLEDGEELNVLDFGGGAESLLNMIKMVKESIDAFSAPKVVNDIGGSDPGSGFAIAQIVTETEVREDHIVQNLQRMLEDMTAFLWSLMRNNVHETVYVASDNTTDGWLGMGGDDLAPGVQYEWNLDPQRASADLVEHRDLHERMDKHTIGRHQAIDRMGDVNPEDVDDDVEIDRIMTTDWYRSRLDKKIMQNLDRADILYDAAAAVVQSGTLPGVGTAPGMATVGTQTVPSISPSTGGGAPPPGPGAPNPLMSAAGQLGAAGSAPAAPGGGGPGPQAISAGEAGAANFTNGPSGAGAITPR
jgi:hypothetical protein